MPKSNNVSCNCKRKKGFIESRLKNVLLWGAIVALLVQKSLSNIITLPNNFEQLANAFLNIMVVIGILNNPTTESQSLFVDENNNGMDDRFENVG